MYKLKWFNLTEDRLRDRSVNPLARVFIFPRGQLRVVRYV
jgi:hypothetical protein